MAASQTDATLWAAEPGKELRVLSFFALATAATALTVNRKPSGSGAAITCAFASANGVPTLQLAYDPHGHFKAPCGEGLSVTTGAGQTTQISAVVAACVAPDAVWDELGVPMLHEDRSVILTESA